MISSRFKKYIAAMAHANPWTWIALLYASQVLGALAITIGFRMDFREVAIAVLLLLLGTALSMLFRSWSRSGRLTHGHHWISTMIYAVPAIIYALFIFSLSHRSFSNVSLSFNAGFFHPVQYATLAIFLCWLNNPVLQNRGTLRFVMRVLVIGIAYGIADEIHQSFIPGRHPNPMDLALDFIGLCVGCGMFLMAGYAREMIEKRVAARDPSESL